MNLVSVEWLDSHFGRSRQNSDRLERGAEPLDCRSVGWGIRDNKVCNVLVPHIAGEKNGEAAIRKTMILRKH
jgi:hypothetical protein